MNYSSDYSRALRYGRLAPKEVWQPFFDHMVGERQAAVERTLAEKAKSRRPLPLGKIHETTRLVLADRLAEEDDPREVLARRHDYHENGSPTVSPDTLHQHAEELHLPDTSWLRYSANAVPTPDSPPGWTLHAKPTYVRLDWFADAARDNGRRLVFGHGTSLTPEEARDFADKLPEEHGQQMHAFLDKHFPRA